MSSGTTFRQSEHVPQEQTRVKVLQSIDSTLPCNPRPARAWYTSNGSKHASGPAGRLHQGRPAARGV